MGLSEYEHMVIVYNTLRTIGCLKIIVILLVIIFLIEFNGITIFTKDHIFLYVYNELFNRMFIKNVNVKKYYWDQCQNICC